MVYEYDVIVDTGLHRIGIISVAVIAATDDDAKEKAIKIVNDRYSSEYAESRRKAKDVRRTLHKLYRKAR